MSRKDFELIARQIKGADLAPSQKLDLAKSFADELAAEPFTRFDRTRFIEACI